MLLSLVLAAEAVPAQAAGRAELAMDGKAVPSGTVVALPEGSVAAFSLKLDGSPGNGLYQRERRGGTGGNGPAVLRWRGCLCGQGDWAVGRACWFVHRWGKGPGDRNCGGAACPACQKTGCASVQVEYGAWHTDGGQRACSHFAYGRMPAKRWTPTMPIDVQHVAPPPS